jgi:hypothetical protein
MSEFQAFRNWLYDGFGGFCRKMADAWKKDVAPLLRILVTCIWSLLVVVIGAGLMIVSDQGGEIALRTGDNLLYALFALLGTLLWAIHTWFDGRRLLEYRFPDQKSLNRWIARMPRLLGSGAFAVALIAFVRAWMRTDGSPGYLPLLALLSALMIFGFYRLVHARTAIAAQMPEALRGKYNIGDLDWLGNWLNPITLFYSALIFLIVTVTPVWYGFAFGSVGIVFVALSSIVWAGSWLTLKVNGAPEAMLRIEPRWLREAALAIFLLALAWNRPVMFVAVIGVLLFFWKFGEKPWLKKLVEFLKLAFSATKGGWQFLVTLLLQLKLLPGVSNQPSAAGNRRSGSRRQGDRGSDFPLLPALFVMALMFSSSGINDNHEVPVTGGSAHRPDIAAYSADWAAQAPMVAGKRPMVIVATAGGGIRAGYWTAAVLGALTDAYPEFRKSLYAISAVSGGSVGAAVYAGGLQAAGQACENSGESGCLTGKLTSALSGEFLAPTVASMLYPDLAQRLLPVRLLPDRAGALEEAWQARWDQVEGLGGAGLDTPLSTLVGQTQQGWQPALLLNSTHVESGKRVIASNIKLENSDDQFQDAVDLIRLLGDKDVRLGTAALNSARFTYVSPPGTLPCGLWQTPCNGHVVDGGYFENFGAVTALQALRAADSQWEKSGKSNAIRPIVILISNDVNLVRDKDRKVRRVIEEQNQPAELPNDRFAMESLGPVYALLHVRDARGILAAKALWKRAGDDGSRFHFSMDLDEGVPEPALGWVLSRDSERMMDNLLLCSESNRAAFTGLLAALGAPKEKIKAYEARPDYCNRNG